MMYLPYDSNFWKPAYPNTPQRFYTQMFTLLIRIERAVEDMETDVDCPTCGAAPLVLLRKDGWAYCGCPDCLEVFGYRETPETAQPGQSSGQGG